MTTHSQLKLEPCLARLGIMPEDKPSFVKEVYAIDDINALRQLLIDKERERQGVANDLDVAARLGLVISETNEAIQVKLSHLEQENQELQNALVYAHDSHQHLHSTNDLYSSSTSNSSSKHSDFINDDRLQLTEELNQARSELDKFRNEMDGLSGQLNDMASEMVDSRSRVSLYAKRLAEVEHKLTLTREMNADLQILLEKALASQKQSSSTTSHLVKNIQSDLIRVVSENDQLRGRIAELEHQQVECEERLSAMVEQAQEYASLLEQAQNTIHMLGEPRLDDDDFLSNDLSNLSVSSSTLDGNNGYKESEVTKGAVFSVEFRQEMQKEIERNLSLRNEIRHRIITADNTQATTDKKRTVQQGLKSLLTERDQGLLAASSSTSTITSSSTSSSSTAAATNSSLSFRSKDENMSLRSLSRATNESSLSPSLSPSSILQTTASSTISPTSATLRSPSPASPINSLRPSNFLTGFNGFSNDHNNNNTIGLNGINTKNFMTRSGGNGRFTTSSSSIIHQHGRNNEYNSEAPSISTRFFQRLASRLEVQENKP
ncbi:hypothetical protein BCR42DRAFT_363206 [Absidia repens]|uniref:HAP1 N-terminal domain-containing protein n=1 Tax=Absidia repens TaxID=90262 RepID=A0A1X2J020_9FUNG|nr:hypothetical protein BCR42DRAFT_363206 [Absidia repens]